MSLQFSKMNVLIFTTLDYKIPCAAKQRLSRLASSLDTLGYKSYLAFSTSDPVHPPFLIDNNLLVFSLPPRDGFSLLYRNYQKFTFCEHIDSLVKDLSIDIVILYSTYSNVIDPINTVCTNLAYHCYGWR